MEHPAPLQRLIDELRRLPGIGPKSAQRIGFHLLKAAREDNQRLSQAIAVLLDETRSCAVCHAITDRETCAVCGSVASLRTMSST